MKSLSTWIGILCFIFTGCRDSLREEVPEDSGLQTRLNFTAGVSIEKSQVLFFRNLTKGDTLVCWLEIEGPKKEFDEHVFRLPAGYYQMKLIGNGEADHIFFSGIPSVENTRIEYADGTQPPDLYYTAIYLKAGEQKRGGAGMIILTSRIALTVEKVPADVKKIRVELKNTSAGVTLYPEILKKATDPCISQELGNIAPGSSPVVHLRSFPSYPATDTTFLQVYGLDTEANVLFEGRSVSFRLGGSEDIQIRCSFGTDREVKNFPSSFKLEKGILPCFSLRKKEIEKMPL